MSNLPVFGTFPGSARGTSEFAANSLGIEANLSKTRQMDVTDKLLCDKLLKTPRLFAYNKDLTAN